MSQHWWTAVVMAADVEGAQRLLEELHRHSRDNFPDSEARFSGRAFSRCAVCSVCVYRRAFVAQVRRRATSTFVDQVSG